MTINFDEMNKYLQKQSLLKLTQNIKKTNT